MLYILTALKPEAQAFVDKYKLKKEKLGRFSIFVSDNTKLIVSGIGVNNAAEATLAIIKHFDLSQDSLFLNGGICAADKNYNVGELIEIGSISYDNKKFIIDANIQKTITCLDEEATDDKYEIADMESFGFYDALVKHPYIKRIHMFKIVSDNFEPEIVTKEGTKSLIFNKIDEIMKKVKKC